MKRILIVLLFCCFMFSCENSSTHTVVYQVTDELFPNPERGFYNLLSSDLGSNYDGLDENVLQSRRTMSQYQSLIGRSFYLKEFINKPISTQALEQIENEFERIRKAGLKCVLRFAYSIEQTEPDAPLSVVLQHLDQLRPCFEKNADVIALMQAGFIGAWGEWFYSSNNLKTAEIRTIILDKILKVLPENRMVQVRTPSYKMEYLRQTSALTRDEAFSGSKAARIGHHNDSFMASTRRIGEEYISRKCKCTYRLQNDENSRFNAKIQRK